MIISAGLGSGLDINAIVDGLVEAEGAAKLAKFDRTEANLQAKLSSFGTLKSAMASFGDAASSLALISTFRAHSAETSNFSAVRADASSTASAGTYSIDVTQLAKAHSLASAPGLFDDQGDAVGTGVLHFSFGTTVYDSGTDYATGDDVYTSFTENTELSSFDIIISASNNSLTGLRDAINDKDAGVQASIVNDGSGYRLLLTSESGVTQSMQITATDDDNDNADLSGLSAFTFSDTATHMEQTQAAQDANFTVNGLNATADSNTVTSVIEGVTLRLQKAEPDAPTTITIRRDDAGIKDAVSTFVDGYNDVIDTLNSLTSYDPDSRAAGVLLGDFTVRTITGRLSREMLSLGSPNQVGFRVLAEIGITSSRTGTLSIDSAKLGDVLKNNFSDVIGLFAANGTTTDSNIRFVTSSGATEEATYAVAITSLDDGDGNMVATIGGSPATVDGTLLSGSARAQGMVLDAAGAQVGNRGTVTFQRGLADRVNAFISGLMGADGILGARTEGLTDQIDELADKREELGERMVKLEARLRRQFTALDGLIANMRSTSDFLATQLEALPPIQIRNRR
jgi:flagellar hook-associated protein 2